MAFDLHIPEAELKNCNVEAVRQFKREAEEKLTRVAYNQVDAAQCKEEIAYYDKLIKAIEEAQKHA